MPQFAPTPIRPAAQPLEVSSDLDLAVIQRCNARELHLTLRPRPGELPAGMVERLAALLREHRATIVRHEVFGALEAYPRFAEALKGCFGKQACPATWLEGRSATAHQIAGMHVMAVADAKVDTLSLDGRVIGRSFVDGHARHCLLTDVRPADHSHPPEQQAAEVFANIEAALDRRGLEMKNVARTWLFVDDILSWYGGLNDVRRDFFKSRRLFEHLVPASTGIGVRNPFDSAIVAGAWAVEPLNGSVGVREVPSPMQCPAPEYGSCFSRAVEIVTPGWRRLLISGTASIEPNGKSAFPGDIDGQIALTMQVVEAILGSRRMGLSSVTRATCYFQNIADAPRFQKWLAGRGIAKWPVILTQGVVCRDDLLFEIELDAMITVERKGPFWEI